MLGKKCVVGIRKRYWGHFENYYNTKALGHPNFELGAKCPDIAIRSKGRRF